MHNSARTWRIVLQYSMQNASHWHVAGDEFYRFQVVVVNSRSSRHAIVVFTTVEVATQTLRVVHVLRQSVDLHVQIALAVSFDAWVRRRHRRTRRHRYLHQHIAEIV